MAKIYESKAGGRLISTAKGKLRFRPDSPGGFGVLRSDDKLLAIKTKLKDTDIEEIIERQADFIGRVPGQAGIWLQEERVDTQASESFSKIRGELKRLGAPALRRKLAEAKLEVPVNATEDELTGLVLEAMATGKIGQGGQADPKGLATDEPVRPARPNLRRGAARAQTED